MDGLDIVHIFLYLIVQAYCLKRQNDTVNLAMEESRDKRSKTG